VFICEAVCSGKDVRVCAAVCAGHHGNDVTPTYNVSANTASSPVAEASRHVDEVPDDDVSTKTPFTDTDCRLCRHSCTDRASLQHHLVQVNQSLWSRDTHCSTTRMQPGLC